MTATLRPDPETSADEPLDRGPYRLMIVGGTIALFAALTLVHDKITLLQAEVDKTSKALPCDLNAFVSCGAVIDTPEASVFGFPNPFMGIVGFSVVVTLGVLLATGATLPRWVWGGLQVGATFGIGLITWLQFQSIYDINRLCPWCMVVWAIMIPLFVLISGRTLRVFAPQSGAARFVTDWSMLIVLLWYVVVLAAIWFQFGSDLWV